MKRFKNPFVQQTLKTEKMKRSIITAVVLTLAAVSLQAQEAEVTPQPIESFVKVEYEPEWYARQAELWHEEALRNPSNDDAWINWFRATRYSMILASDFDSVDDEKLAAIAETVRRQRPESYARYMLDYFCSMWTKGPHDYPDNMIKAIKMRPDNRILYPDYVVYLLKNGNQELMDDILKRWYNTGEYSYNLLNYAYNEMVGMQQNGIIFVNGDTPTYSKLLVKHGKELFPDKTVICMSLLVLPEYRSFISSELGISPIPEPDYQDYDKWTDQAVMHIITESKRPCYFSAVIPQLPSFQDKLYSEGLIYKYSDKRYDNLAVKKENFEKRYLLDYLYEQFTPETYEASAYRLNLNYIPCLKSLLDYYKESGQKQQHLKLYGMMKRIVVKAQGISDQKRKEYNDEIDR
jgi:hypothetical protein